MQFKDEYLQIDLLEDDIADEQTKAREEAREDARELWSPSLMVTERLQAHKLILVALSWFVCHLNLNSVFEFGEDRSLAVESIEIANIDGHRN